MTKSKARSKNPLRDTPTGVPGPEVEQLAQKTKAMAAALWNLPSAMVHVRVCRGLPETHAAYFAYVQCSSAVTLSACIQGRGHTDLAALKELHTKIEIQLSARINSLSATLHEHSLSQWARSSQSAEGKK